jgi:hypothetical protein
MRKTVRRPALLIAGLALLAGGTARASEFDETMESILGEYLKIHQALAADETQGVTGSAEAIQHTLDPAVASPEHAEHYQQVPKDISSASGKLRQAKDLASMREGFKELSKPISMWVGMAKPAGKSVMYCSMAKAGWVQEGTEAANPYYGAQMHGCGHRVGGAE